jgi:hypothetical protein
MTVPVETNIWANDVLDDGFCYADGFHANFWWILNREWYKMQNQMYSYTGCTEPYVDPIDFEEIYESD